MIFKGLLKKLTGEIPGFKLQTEVLVSIYEKRAEQSMRIMGYEKVKGLSEEQSKRLHFLKAVASEVVNDGMIDRNPIILDEYIKITKEADKLKALGVYNG